MPTVDQLNEKNNRLGDKILELITIKSPAFNDLNYQDSLELRNRVDLICSEVHKVLELAKINASDVILPDGRFEGATLKDVLDSTRDNVQDMVNYLRIKRDMKRLYKNV